MDVAKVIQEPVLHALFSVQNNVQKRKEIAYLLPIDRRVNPLDQFLACRVVTLHPAQDPNSMPTSIRKRYCALTEIRQVHSTDVIGFADEVFVVVVGGRHVVESQE